MGRCKNCLHAVIHVMFPKPGYVHRDLHHDKTCTCRKPEKKEGT